MNSIVVTLLFVALLVANAVRAERRFASFPNIPMQWGLSGQVNWWAPRRIGIAFIPTLAVLIFISLLVADWNLDPLPDQTGMVLPASVTTGLAMLATQLLHL